MAASDVQDYLLCVESDKAEAHRIAAGTAEKLQSRQNSLLDVVQSLGEYINDEDSRIRGRAVSYLTTVLSALPPKYLSRQQIDVLCHFFSNRIHDGGAIEGLTKLQDLDRFTDEMAQTVVRAVFEHFPDFRIRPPSARRHILQLLNHLMSRHRKALRMMGDESLVGIIELVNGEKDPRSLMLVFSMCRVLIIEWDISNNAEALFNTVYAYFPITFRPPPNDPYGITAQDLKDRLRDCISASKYLAPYAIPNLLDKLDSTYSIVKKDVLQALLACAGSYDASTMSLYSITLWDCLKFEVLSAQEPELAEETLVVLRAIAKCLSRSSQNSVTASLLAQYTRPITKECIEHLQEPLQRQAKASGDILKAVSSATPEAFDSVAKAVMAPILTIYQSTAEIAKHRALLIVLNQLFDSAVVVFGHWTSTDPHPGIDNPLEAFSEKLLEVLGQSLMSTVREEVSFRVTSAQGLQKLAVVRDLLPESEVRMIVHHFNEIVLHGESDGHDELKRTAMEGLAEISKHKPGLIMDVTFPAFMAQLPDTDEEAEARGDYHTTLEGLAEISIQKEVFDTLVRRLLSRLEILLKTNVIESPRYTSALLSTICFIMNRKGLEHDVNTPVYFDRIVTALLSRATKSAVGESRPTALNDVTVLEVLGRLSNLIVRHSSNQNKALAADNVYDLFSMQSGFEKLAQASKDSLLEGTWILSTWLLAALPRNLQAPLLQPSIYPSSASTVAGAALALAQFFSAPPSSDPRGPTARSHGRYGQTVLLTGAGISVASGLADYRGENGTYTQNRTYRPIYFNEFVDSHEARKRYWARSFLGWTSLHKAKPNAAHFAIGDLAKRGFISSVITQNVDSFHSQAHPCLPTIELHGYLRALVCINCRGLMPRDQFQAALSRLNPAWATFLEELLSTGALDSENPAERRKKGYRTNPDGDADVPGAPYTTFRYPACPTCLKNPPTLSDGSRGHVEVDRDGAWSWKSNSGILKPNVIMFGESISPEVKAAAEEAIVVADRILIIGSSLATYSAWRLAKKAHDRGMPIAILNLGGVRKEETFLANLGSRLAGGEAAVRASLPAELVLPAILDHL